MRVKTMTSHMGVILGNAHEWHAMHVKPWFTNVSVVAWGTWVWGSLRTEHTLPMCLPMACKHIQAWHTVTCLLCDDMACHFLSCRVMPCHGHVVSRHAMPPCLQITANPLESLSIHETPKQSMHNPCQSATSLYHASCVPAPGMQEQTMANGTPAPRAFRENPRLLPRGRRRACN